MRHALLVFALGWVVTADPLHSQPHPGVALRWNHCFGEGTGAIVRSFACDTNAGLEELVGSFAVRTCPNRAVSRSSSTSSRASCNLDCHFRTAPSPSGGSSSKGGPAGGRRS